MRPWLLACPLVLAALGCGGPTTSATSTTTTTATTGAGGSHTTSSTGGASASTTASSASSTTTSSASAGGSGGAGGAGGSLACSGLTFGPGMHMGTVLEGTTMRTYLVHAPPSYDPTKRTPLVLVFHGLTQTSAGIEAQTQMDPVSDKHGFLTVYPQGLNNSWNAGDCCGNSASSGVDDVKFTRDLLDQLAKDYCVDPRRVFSSGFSNGGMLSHRLACEVSDRIAAIGAVSGTLAISNCAPTRPVPVLHIHGTGDIVVGYPDGGFSGAKGVPSTIANWVNQDGCTDVTPATVFMKGNATCTEYVMCKPGTNVELCTIDQGGHQWPGGQDDFIGLLSTDLDASETIAEFFEQHPMP